MAVATAAMVLCDEAFTPFATSTVVAPMMVPPGSSVMPTMSAAVRFVSPPCVNVHVRESSFDANAMPVSLSSPLFVMVSRWLCGP